MLELPHIIVSPTCSLPLTQHSAEKLITIYYCDKNPHHPRKSTLPQATLGFCLDLFRLGRKIRVLAPPEPKIVTFNISSFSFNLHRREENIPLLVHLEQLSTSCSLGSVAANMLSRFPQEVRLEIFHLVFAKYRRGQIVVRVEETAERFKYKFTCEHDERNYAGAISCLNAAIVGEGVAAAASEALYKHSRMFGLTSNLDYKFTITGKTRRTRKRVSDGTMTEAGSQTQRQCRYPSTSAEQ